MAIGVERTTEERDLTDLSPNRVRVLNQCGLAFKYNYIDHLPSPSESASMIFGNAIHNGVYDWYGDGATTAENAHQHKDLDLVDLVRGQWPKLLPPKVWETILEMIELDKERAAVAQAILLKRPGLKAPTSTKEFLESDASKNFVAKQIEMRELADKLEEVRWPKDEDAYQAYQRSERIAHRMQREWKPLPRPLAVEEPFRLEFEGFVVRGRIDQVRHDPDLDSGEMGEPEVTDIKSGKQLMTQMESFVQAFLYTEAARQIEWLPDTTRVSFPMVRHEDDQGRTKVQRGVIDYERHKKLAARILRSVGRKIITADFEPHYGMWCKSCDFRDLCEKEIAIWVEDGLTEGGD